MCKCDRKIILIGFRWCVKCISEEIENILIPPPLLVCIKLYNNI